MKKLLIILFVASTLCVQAQQYENLHVEDFPGMYFYCFDNEISGLVIYGEEGCSAHWYAFPSGGGNFLEWNNVDSIVIYNPHEPMMYDIQYDGCEINTGCTIAIDVLPMNPFVEPIIWTRQNEIEPITLNADPDGLELNYEWSTGETTQVIEVTEPGIYSVTITNDCGSATYSVEVRDNVEIYRATCDLVSNLNQVTWHTTPEQSEYITAVKVYRNNELVGTVPYTDGVFTDNMGSENTQWQYHIVGVSVEGEDCPIPSYWKRTIHLDHVQGTQGDHILQWTPYAEESPEKSEVTAYRIFDVVDGVPTQVIDVGNFTNVYTYNPADFHGYGVVAAVFADDKGLEELAFSNKTFEMLNVDENSAQRTRIYPNPANGRFTVEGTGMMHITNALGQEIMVKEIDGKTAIELPQGFYFVKLNNMVRKIVVE